MTDSSVTGLLQNVSGTLVLVGAGKMGGAMLQGWITLGYPLEKIAVLEPNPSDEIVGAGREGAHINPPPSDIKDVAFLVLAVKPQVAAQIVPPLKSLVGPRTVVVSVMAGRTLAFLTNALGDCAIVRSIPNTPAAIGRGITVAVANAKVTPSQRQVAQRLLAAVGAVEWVDDEGLIDAATAVSGSGPAYVFLLAESLARAGAAVGLPEDLSARLAYMTVAGSGELMHRSGLDAATLRQNVTSPAGTTAAALAVLMADDGLDPLMKKRSRP
ncbi:MAG: pyrroline-5-carboxylate reductase, partial [Hyphomicrobiales bacterium]|nr:pyrroline-5-carboxylate reductase [Hyphomicrobiales bacterium]